MSIDIFRYIYRYTCIFVYLYTCQYARINTHTYMHIHTYTQKSKSSIQLACVKKYHKEKDKVSNNSYNEVQTSKFGVLTHRKSYRSNVAAKKYQKHTLKAT